MSGEFTVDHIEKAIQKTMISSAQISRAQIVPSVEIELAELRLEVRRDKEKAEKFEEKVAVAVTTLHQNDVTLRGWVWYLAWMMGLSMLINMIVLYQSLMGHGS